MTLLIKEIIRFAVKDKIKYLEFKSTKTRLPFETDNHRKDLRHTLNLIIGEKDLFSNFSENTKRNIKKADKSKLRLSILNNERGIEIFYKMMCETRKKHGLPPQPFSFFLNIGRYIIMSRLGDIFLASKDENYIAGAIYFKIGKKVLYKYGASYNKYNELRGNHFVMWQAIKKYMSEGYKEFDFGRTETTNEGLRRFKLGWSTVESFIYTTKYDPLERIFLPASTKTEGIHNKIFHFAPSLVSRLIGTLLYKHIG